MRHRTSLLVALVLVVGGLAGAGTAMGHTEEDNTEHSYRITDQGVLTGYGGPVVNPLGGHVENPATGENVFVPGANMDVTTDADGEHNHVGNAVTYSIYVNGTSADGDDYSAISATVDYENEDLSPTGALHVPTADLDLYLYGPNGDIISASEGFDGGGSFVGGSDLPAGSYTVLLVARHGVPAGVDTGVCPTCPSVDPGDAGVGVGYETTITVTD